MLLSVSQQTLLVLITLSSEQFNTLSADYEIIPKIFSNRRHFGGKKLSLGKYNPDIQQAGSRIGCHLPLFE
jgi:hypothetical protein